MEFVKPGTVKTKEIPFELDTPLKPAGDQPKAIKQLCENLDKGIKTQTLIGATGTGKTFTMSHIIQHLNKPTLVLAHNKTLAAQLYNELKELFPKNRVEYFVSYYDYYQPESYVPQRDLYIEKDAQINPSIERMRLAATASLMSETDTIIVASVSCIYGLGNPENFTTLGFEITKGQTINKQEFIKKLIDILYERNDFELQSGKFRVKGDTIDFIPGYMQDIIRINFFGDEIEDIKIVHKTSMEIIDKPNYFFIYPARHFVSNEEDTKLALTSIREELEEHLPTLNDLEAHRLKSRTSYDLELIEETGTCKGIENYSRHFDKRKAGEKPYVLLDFFPKEFLIIIDESHQTIPQFNGMYKGDRSRKQNLVDFGFRLPSALDNRPLQFHEFEKYLENQQTIFVSATPADYELKKSQAVVEQIIRPTGLLDPEVFVHESKDQIAHVTKQIEKVIANNNRALITTLTKKSAEELSEYLAQKGIKTRYLHSDIDTIERTEIIRELRLGVFDVLVGINLLREGIDIPEVAFVGILDADKEGFLRNKRSLIQIIGRAARNAESIVYLYADVMTDSIKGAIEETKRRRNLQIAHNKKHGITPITIQKAIREKEVDITDTKHIPKNDIPNVIIEVEAQMRLAAENLDFEEAIRLREKLKNLEKRLDE